MRKVRLEDIFEFIRNGAQIKQFDGAGIPITRIETISNLKIDTNRLGYADIFNDDYQEYYLQNGDLLMSHINSPAHLGKTAIVEQLNKKIIHGMNLLCLRANHQVIPKYIFYYFQTQPFKNALTKIMKKSVNQASISVSDLKKIEITISSYSEQSNSVAILEQLDYQISLRQQQLQTLAHLVKSRFYEQFGDLSTNPYGFPIVYLSEIAEYYNGLTYKPEMVVEDGSGTIVLRSSNIQDSKLDFNDIVRVNIQAKEKNIVRKNDILMCSRNGSERLVGKTAIINTTEKMYFGAFMMLIRSKYFEFLQQYFQTEHFRSTVRQGATTTINQITVKMMDKVKIPLPPLALQNQFADFVAEVDKSQLACQKSLDELETLKKSLMQAYFG